MKKLFTLFALTLLTLSAQAREVTVDLPIRGEYYSGQTFRLKAMIKQQNPRLDLSRARLERVDFMMKSRRDTDLTLYVGQDQSRQFVYGSRRNYDDRRGFENVTLFAPYSRGPGNEGRWQLSVDTRGEYKITRASVTFRIREDRRPAPRPNPTPRPNPRPRPDRDHDRDGVVQTCGYVRETAWGTDLQKYYRDARGDNRAEALARACEQAKRACRSDMSSFLEKCKQL